MSDQSKDNDNIQMTVSSERRDLLKTGIALVVAPLFAGVSSVVRPAKAQAEGPAKAGKNVLVISASPREGGNSDLLCDEFMRGAKEAGHTVEKIRLTDRDINYCTGCLYCIGGRGECSQHDDMGEIFEKILAANVIVLASPVYFLTFNAQMKTFVDRLCPIYSQIHGKDFYFILSAAGGQSSIDSAVQGFRVFTGCLYGNEEKGIIASTGFWDAGRVKGTGVMRQAYDRGRNA